MTLAETSPWHKRRGVDCPAVKQLHAVFAVFFKTFSFPSAPSMLLHGLRESIVSQLLGTLMVVVPTPRIMSGNVVKHCLENYNPQSVLCLR